MVFTLLFTIQLLILVTKEIPNSTAHLVFKVEELEVEENHDFLVDDPYLYQMPHNLPLVPFIPENCSDVKPPNSTITCQEIQKAGLCDDIPCQFCKLSCKTCPDFTPLCKIISSNGLCIDTITNKGYCLKECNNPCSKLTEAQVLMTLKKSIQYPGQLPSWIGEDPCDGWYGVVCKNGHVSELRLGYDYFNIQTKKWIDTPQILINVATSIPAELSCLKHLNGLYLGNTGFNKKLPPEFSTLKKLFAINIDNNQITGSLPPEFSTWTNLIAFAADNNYLVGSIPKQFSRWRSIDQFWVDGNQLKGKIPLQFSTWSKIQVFNACYGYNNLCTPPSFKKFNTGCPAC